MTHVSYEIICSIYAYLWSSRLRSALHDYVKKENVPTNIYNQKWMLDTILDVQEDIKGETPSYTLSIDSFNSLNETLLKYGYISKPVEYNRFTGGDLCK